MHVSSAPSAPAATATATATPPATSTAASKSKFTPAPPVCICSVRCPIHDTLPHNNSVESLSSVATPTDSAVDSLSDALSYVTVGG